MDIPTDNLNPADKPNYRYLGVVAGSTMGVLFLILWFFGFFAFFIDFVLVLIFTGTGTALVFLALGLVGSDKMRGTMRLANKWMDVKPETIFPIESYQLHLKEQIKFGMDVSIVVFATIVGFIFGLAAYYFSL